MKIESLKIESDGMTTQVYINGKRQENVSFVDFSHGIDMDSRPKLEIGYSYYLDGSKSCQEKHKEVINFVHT